MVVGRNGVIYSPTGVTWTYVQIGATIILRSVVWTGNLLVAVGDGGVIYTSPQDPPDPPAPILNSPSTGTPGIPISTTLTWYASSGAVTYRLQLSIDSNFTTTVVNDSTITTISRAVGPLTGNTVYYWRVNAKNTLGTSAYSAKSRFTTATVAISLKEISIQRLNLENGQSLRFNLPQRAHVVIQLFNTKGRMVSQLLDDTRDAGVYTLPLSASLKGSYYLLDFRAGDMHKTMKIH